MEQRLTPAAVAKDEITLLGTDILQSHSGLVSEFKSLARTLDLELGWHYLLDLAWAAEKLASRPSPRVLDAGAGTGAMQWWLAAQGRDVVSVDFFDRSALDLKFTAWCSIQGLRPEDFRPRSPSRVRAFLPPRRPTQWKRWPRKLSRSVRNAFAAPPPGRGTVTLYNHDLSRMPDVADESVDAIVSISALEHNEPAQLRVVVRELMRVLKPGGTLVATLGASRDKDWFHEPSKGWCYTEATLRKIFDLPANTPSNYASFDSLMEGVRDSASLRESLPRLYYESGNNGMPWGVWDPKYLSVGVVKTKER